MSMPYSGESRRSGVPVWVLLWVLVSMAGIGGRVSAQATPPAAYPSVKLVSSVRSWQATAPVQTVTDLTSRPSTDVVQTTEYTDGLGRPLQTVVKQASPAGNDLVTANAYDALSGREMNTYLPFTSTHTSGGTETTNDGNFKLNPFQQQTTFYSSLLSGQGTDASWTYGQVSYENSPLNRTAATYASGSNWVGSAHGITVRYLANLAADNVQIWTASASQGGLPQNGGAYSSGQLYKIITTDENGSQSITYKNKDGQVILVKTQLTAAPDDGISGSTHAGWLCTYYVYDDYGNLRLTITPKVVAAIDGSWSVSQQMMDELCYRYEYDLFNRQVIKKAPGAGEEWLVYDQRGRLVMSQDANRRAAHQWMYYQYDGLDRSTNWGVLTDPGNYNNLSYHQNLAAGSTGYPTLSSYTYEVLTQTYYDDYSQIGSQTGMASTLDASYTSNTTYFLAGSNTAYPYAEAIAQTVMTRGLVTGTKAEVLGSGGTYLYTESFYDNKGRAVQIQATNISGGTDKTSTQYGWDGKVLRTLVQHSKASGTVQSHLVLTKMIYSSSSRRLSSVTESISSTIGSTTVSSGDRTLSTYSYDETGRVIGKAIGPETQAYSYNIRGWLTGINKAFTQSSATGASFGMELGYDKTATASGTTTFAAQQYNGSLTGTVWKSGGDGIARKYDYTYDKANELAGAAFTQNTGGGTTWDKSYIDYSVSGLSYDQNGNLTAMQQNGFAMGSSPVTDNLSYRYKNPGTVSLSNQLLNVQDLAPNTVVSLRDFPYTGSKAATTADYGYDPNGNISSDASKGITSITYNVLNLPSVVTFPFGKSITYTYDALGHKLKKVALELVAGVYVPGSGSLTTSINTPTTYIGNFVYQSKTFSNSAVNAVYGAPESLLYVLHEEGRAKIVTSQATAQPAYVFDYFIRDNLGNVRTTLTDESWQDQLPAATLESSTITSEQNYYEITNDNSHIIKTTTLPWFAGASGSGYANNNQGLPNPGCPNPAAASSYVYKLAAGSGTSEFGLGITLRVMAGDNISIYGKSVWHSNGTPVSNPSGNALNNVLSSLVNALASSYGVYKAAKGVTGSALNANATTTGSLSNWITGTTPGGVPTPPSAPKAYINYILFDDQFNVVQSGSTGYDAVSTTADIIKSHSIIGKTMTKSGYLYIYCSNESNQDVYFDNLQVFNTRGNLLEERHYYPDGLLMGAISSRAFNKLPTMYGYQGKEMQNAEWWDGSGWESYDFESRYYDPQLGVWHNPDPMGQFASPYMAMGNNWTNGTDPDGQFFGVDDAIVSGIGFVYGYISSGIKTGHWGGKALLNGGINAAMFELGYLTAGGGLAANASVSTAETFLETQAVNMAVGQLFPSVPVFESGNFSLSISPSFSLADGGGLSLTGSYQSGDFTFGASLGFRGSASRIGGGVHYLDSHDRGFALGITKFGGQYKQALWEAQVQRGDFSFAINEDWKLGGDKYRTLAAEVGVGNFRLGATLFTTNHSDDALKPAFTHSMWGDGNKMGQWRLGSRISSALYVGYQDGNNVYRFGIDAPKVFDFFENGFHRIGSNTPQWDAGYGQPSKPYFYYGNYDPYTMY